MSRPEKGGTWEIQFETLSIQHLLVDKIEHQGVFFYFWVTNQGTRHSKRSDK